MKPFAKLFELPEFGQVLAVVQRGGDHDKPTLTWSVCPPGLDVCSFSLGFDDSDAGWDTAEKALSGTDEAQALKVAELIFQGAQELTP